MKFCHLFTILIFIVLISCTENDSKSEITLKEDDGVIIISNLFSEIENEDFDISMIVESEGEHKCGLVNVSKGNEKVELGTTQSGCEITYTSNNSSQINTEAFNSLNEVVFRKEYWNQLKVLIDKEDVVPEIRLKRTQDQLSLIFYYQINSIKDSVVFDVNKLAI